MVSNSAGISAAVVPYEPSTRLPRQRNRKTDRFGGPKVVCKKKHCSGRGAQMGLWRPRRPGMEQIEDYAVAMIMGHRWEVRSCRRPRSSHTRPLTREMLTGLMLVGSLGAAGGVGAGVGRQVLKIENILKMTRMILRAKNLRCTHSTSGGSATSTTRHSPRRHCHFYRT